MDPKKVSAEWFRQNVFRDESLSAAGARRPAVPAKPAGKVPSAILVARVMANVGFESWQSRERVFLKQAKLLEHYKDDFEMDCRELQVYCPTYQSLSDQELRTYFTWRTRVRQGELRAANRCFALLYLFELLNQIGVSDPADGYQKLVEFRDAYQGMDDFFRSMIEQWRVSYVVYYGLDAALLSDTAQVRRDRCFITLEHIREREDAEAAAAVRECSQNWLKRSRFYSSHREDMDRVMVRVVRRVSAHCAPLKKNMLERYFGPLQYRYVELFPSAVFCDPLKRKDYVYTLDEQCVYSCKDRVWTVCRREPSPAARGKFDNLLKAIDASMRTAFAYGHPITAKPESKWVMRIIEEEVGALLAERQAAQAAQQAQEARKVSIDFRQLKRIRADAAATREKLIVEEEAETPEEPTPPEQPPVPAEESQGLGLDPAEERLVRCLLYGGDLGWVQEEGRLLSVLADGVNEKLYEVFADSVLDDSPQVVEDYIDDLKEMIHP